MEACGGAHHWARELKARGYEVKLIPPQFVKPYVNQKDDAADAAAICEAMSRSEMRFVPVKTIEQQDIQAIHRIRSLVMGERTAKSNQIRGLVTEYGLVAPPHVGPLVSTALVARIGDGQQFKRGRQAAASVGLTPRHHGTGGRNRLYGITKQGDRYLRSILIHGARAVLSQAKRCDDPLSVWVTDLADRTHPNVAAVALANKTVRVAWGMLRHGTDYDPQFAVV